MAKQIEPVIDLTARTVTFNIADGQPPLVFDMGKAHPDMIARAALVGFAQVRIVDAAAVERQDDDGNVRPEAEMLRLKRERMAALIAHIESGTAEWGRKASGNGGGKSLTIEAIARVKGIGYDDAKAMVARHAEAKYDGDTRKALAALRGGQQVQTAMEAIRKSRQSAPKLDADAELANLA